MTLHVRPDLGLAYGSGLERARFLLCAAGTRSIGITNDEIEQTVAIAAGTLGFPSAVAASPTPG